VGGRWEEGIGRPIQDPYEGKEKPFPSMKEGKRGRREVLVS